MTIRVEHEMHRRRFGRNLGLGLVLAGLVAITFGLTVVKVMSLGDITKMEGFDYVPRSPSVADPAVTSPGTP